eukprot:3089225-Amphidinium_carterae.2
MPARYSGQREQLEAKIKLFHVTVLSEFATKLDDHSWEALRKWLLEEDTSPLLIKFRERVVEALAKPASLPSCEVRLIH